MMWLRMIFLPLYVASGIQNLPSRFTPIWKFLKDALPTEQAALIEDKKLLKSGEAKIKTLTADIFFQNLSLAQKKERGEPRRILSSSGREKLSDTIGWD